MKDFKRWINEPVLPNVQTTIDTLRDRKDRKDLIRRIQAADPYQDKRFSPIIARWVVKLGITPEEHKDDVVLFKSLHRRLKGLRVPATNRQRTAMVKALLAKKPEDFTGHYSTLQDWNRQASDILDPNRDLSDENLPVVMRYGGYTMYRIDTEEQCLVPLVKNTMGWCVTKGSFGGYGGPPYYPVVRDRDREPFAMIIPAHFDRDPDEAVRNAENTGRLSPIGLAKIRPLVQRALPIDKHEHPYINGVHGVRPELPARPSAAEAFNIIKDYGLEPGDWPAGEEAVARDPVHAYWYARDILNGPFPAGEDAISQEPSPSCNYALHLLKAPFPKGEQAISRYGYYALEYASKVLKAPFPAGEEAISRDAHTAFVYADDVLKGPFPAGEEAISQMFRHSYRYALDVLKAPFPAGEPAISQEPEYAYWYAKIVLKAPFPLGEPAINRDPGYKKIYDKFLETLEKPTMR